MAPGSLASYRRKRDPDRTPEPIPAVGSTRTRKNKRPTFVVQEHHASSLHWDFRLERDGVLASWALPKGVPMFPDQNHLAVQVEDHPLEYGSFSGTIPAGEYGGGEVSIWDHGVYDCEKWLPKEIMVVLHGQRVEGRYVLFPTKGKNWMIHRMDPAPEGFAPLPTHLSPMLAVADRLPPDDGRWAYEFKWDGMRVLVWVDGGRLRMVSRNDNDVTGSFPDLRGFAESLASHQALLDGELVVLGHDGKPSFSQLQHRIHAGSPASAQRLAPASPASLVVFDLLHLDGASLLDRAYDQRRSALEALGIGAPNWAVTPSFTDVTGREILRVAVDAGMEGVVAKRRTSLYRPGQRSREWIKVKHQRTQEMVIGGYTKGKGGRRADFGALLLGVPAAGTAKLTFVGKVGTGFSEADRGDLLVRLRRIERATSPFDAPLPTGLRKEATFVSPKMVGEVRFGEWTPDGHLRHPVWRGLRPDKSSAEVRREP
ncbi:MAG TPA: non-homologous end-joining DNA ligase [Acidimicrobiales bacterium]